MEAQQARYELQRAHDEMGELRQHVAALSAQRPAAAAATAGISSDVSAALEAARLEAADARCCQQLAELELSKQLDALQELQWQLDCVVGQLGLQGGSMLPSAGASGASPAAAAAGAPALVTAGGAGPEEHLPLMLAKVEELRAAQLELGETKRRLAAAEAALADTRQRNPHPAAAATAAAVAAVPGGREEVCRGQEGRQLVGQLLQENEELRRRLAEAEVRARGEASVPSMCPCGVQLQSRHACGDSMLLLFTNALILPCRSSAAAWRGTWRWSCCSGRRPRRQAPAEALPLRLLPPRRAGAVPVPVPLALPAGLPMRPAARPAAPAGSRQH